MSSNSKFVSIPFVWILQAQPPPSKHLVRRAEFQVTVPGSCQWIQWGDIGGLSSSILRDLRFLFRKRRHSGCISSELATTLRFSRARIDFEVSNAGNCDLRHRHPSFRSQLFQDWSAFKIQDNAEDLATIMTLKSGKPL